MNESGEPKSVVAYTDGACIGNPGPGGYGVVLLYRDRRRELSGGFRTTTNNRMELLAPIIGLEALMQTCNVTIYSDSEYVVNGIEKGWAQKWRADGWRRNKKESALNTDLWSKLLDACALHNVQFVWVRGHAGNTENERCDQLAMEAARGAPSIIDTVYESLSVVRSVVHDYHQ
jgi:ribonuclease HI